jgi:hypothetical protein
MITDRRAFILENTRLQAPPHAPELSLHLADEITPIWRMTEEALGEMGLAPPFWAFAWAGGQGLEVVLCGKDEERQAALHVAAADLRDVGPLGKGLAEGLATLLTLQGVEVGSRVVQVECGLILHIPSGCHHGQQVCPAREEQQAHLLVTVGSCKPKRSEAVISGAWVCAAIQQVGGHGEAVVG